MFCWNWNMWYRENYCLSFVDKEMETPPVYAVILNKINVNGLIVKMVVHCTWLCWKQLWAKLMKQKVNCLLPSWHSRLLLFVAFTSHIVSLAEVPANPSPIQLPANVSGKATEDGLNVWVPATHRETRRLFPGCSLALDWILLPFGIGSSESFLPSSLLCVTLLLR